MRTHWLDVIVFVLLAISAVKGWRRGFILEVLTILGLLVGVVAGFLLHNTVADLTRDFFPIPGWALQIGAFTLTAGVVYRIWLWLSKQTSESFKVTGLGMADQVLGALFGLLKSCLLLAAVFWIVNLIHIKALRKQLQDSYIAADAVYIGHQEFYLLSKSAPVFERWYYQAADLVKAEGTGASFKKKSEKSS